METMDFPRTPDSVIRTSIETALRRLPDQAPQYRHAIYARARRTITENSPEHIAVLEEVIADLEVLEILQEECGEISLELVNLLLEDDSDTGILDSGLFDEWLEEEISGENF